MTEIPDTEEQAVLDAVREYAIDRHHDLSSSNVLGFDEDELMEMQVDTSGNLVYSIEHVKIQEIELDEDGLPTYYVEATIYFYKLDGEDIMGSTDIYQCYKCKDPISHKNTWCIQWYAE